ncbi:aminoglycoside adenylyltransferase domain-containing protein [Nocardioides sp.]|uniref:aminoglycoside adenylyltransferase domain-containing protein n=1 Tax=Nocardioides sp. TaxID=35761 RepID=UPI002BA7FCFC|nr:aminoglycoside adenylyltransferase domain-containing protein [Nocardioides sp.]HXH78561.1 aminoglycoside adenylyltransferase domain-containing protein [Nocardioides sp.]
MTADQLTAILERQLDRPEAELLRTVLAALDHQVRSALGDSVVGIYLKGSFALGSGDSHSDVDFLVVTHDELTPAEEQRVRALHRSFPDRTENWAHVLEGSYAPADALARRADGTPWLYVDNGQREMELSTHDNTEVFRWVLKHHAVVVSGAVGGSLVPQVPDSAVRDEAARLAVERHDSALAEPEYLANGWGQPHEVLTNCRMLYTATTGAVCGKVAAAQWCLDIVADEWLPLIRAAISSRPDPWQRVHQQADPELTARTAPFITYMTSSILEAAERPALREPVGPN